MTKITVPVALRQCIQEFPEGASEDELIQAVYENYSEDRWKPGTFRAHRYGCRVNNVASYRNYPSTKKFLYYDENEEKYHLYQAEKHGPNVWMPRSDDPEDIENTNNDDVIEASLSLERDVEHYLIQKLDSIETGLTFEDRQVSIDVGRVDILARDIDGRRVVIELKVGEAKDAAIGQIACYLGWYTHEDGEAARGILIASDFPDPVCYAAKMIKGLSLIRYEVAFSFEWI